MANPTAGLSYPFDPTGTLATNRITNEQQIITAQNGHGYHFIVPNLAPYFEDSLKLSYRDPQGVYRPLIKNVDWYSSHTFIQASRACAKPISGSISFLNNQLTGVVTLEYQTVGGSWTLDPAKIAQILADKLNNPRITTWEEVVGYPIKFPVIDHEWDLVDLVGMSSAVEVLKRIEDQLRQSGQSGLAEHIANKNNPHGVDKSQVGLGQVNNYATATPEQTSAGLLDTLYVTPLGLATAIRVGVGSNLKTHLEDWSNPHRVTAAQTGAYSKAEADQLLGGKLDKTGIAADTAKFDNLTALEYSARVLTGTAANATKAFGLTLNELKSEIQGGPSADAERFAGHTYEETRTDFMSGEAASATRFGNRTYQEARDDIRNGKSADSGALEGRTYEQVKAGVLTGTANNSNLLGGRTPDELAAYVLAGTAHNATLFDNRTFAQAKAEILTGRISDADKLEGKTSADIVAEARNGTVSNSTLFAMYSVDEYKTFVLQGQAADSAKLGGQTPAQWTSYIDGKSATVQADLNTTKANLSSTQSDLNTTKTNLANTQSELAAFKAEVYAGFDQMAAIFAQFNASLG